MSTVYYRYIVETLGNSWAKKTLLILLSSMLLPPSSFFLLLAKSRGFFHLHVHVVSSIAKALLSISGLPTSYFKLFFSTSKSAFQLFTGTIRRCHSHLKCNRSPQEPTPSSSLLQCVPRSDPSFIILVNFSGIIG